MPLEKTSIETETLLSRIQQQTVTIQKLKSQQSKLAQYVQEFKAALKRKQQKQSSQQNKKSEQNQEKLEKQLEKQVENAKTMLKNYQHQLRNLQKKVLKNTYTPDDLMKLEQKLKLKETQLKQVQEDIKDLKIVKRKQQKLIQKKEKNEQNDGIKLAKLVQDVRKQKQLLDSLKSKSNKKQEQLQKKKLQIAQLQAKYNQKCKTTGQTPSNFQDFKQKRKQKRKQQISLSTSKNKQKPIKKVLTVKEIINNQYHSDNIEPTEKNLKQLKVKKQVAENSLKMAQKKDQKQIEELKAKMERLKEENQMLQSKLVQKIKEKQQTEIMDNNSSGNHGDKLYEGKKSKFQQSKSKKFSKNSQSLSKSQNPSNPSFKLEPIHK